MADYIPECISIIQESVHQIFLFLFKLKNARNYSNVRWGQGHKCVMVGAGYISVVKCETYTQCIEVHVPNQTFDPEKWWLNHLTLKSKKRKKKKKDETKLAQYVYHIYRYGLYVRKPKGDMCLYVVFCHIRQFFTHAEMVAAYVSLSGEVPSIVSYMYAC